ncbi:MAG: alpha amylase C-terminal domain-containing protein [Pseudomonadota bacterium]|nr:alpha amylase C-terminal domain-containing protein [Pseudomonadota bacterium]
MKTPYLLLLLLAVYSPNLRASITCPSLFGTQDFELRPDLAWYESQRTIGLKATKNINGFSPKQGIFVTKRDSSKREVEATIRVLSDNPHNKIEVIGDFNDWGKKGSVVLQADSDPVYSIGVIKNLKHGDQYRILVNGQALLDPSSMTYTTPEFSKKMYGQNTRFLNSVFWDIEGEGHYEHKNPIVDLRAKPLSITEIEVQALVARYNGGPKAPEDTYNFVANSGIIPQLKARGINAVEFLPFNSAADGNEWSKRYQVYGVFGIESKYGTPAEFARMVDKFNEAGIAVIMDVLLSHYPFDGNSDVRRLKDIGLSNWKKADGRPLYGDQLTEWQTYRYDYRNPYVRRFLIDSVLNTIKHFHIGGIRIDNYDGIRFLPGGTELLKELAAEIRAYAPQLWLNAEMFFPENAVTKRLDWGGHGMNAYNNGNFFWKIIRSMAQKRTDEINMNTIKDVLRDDWQWKEAMRLLYATNHDEAANKLEGATGAYFATLVGGGGWQYVEGKTRVFASLAMMAGSYYMDMPQLRIMQEGTFYKNSAVEWDLLKFDSQRNMDRYFSDLSNFFISDAAFAPHNLHANIENHIDPINKVLSMERVDYRTGKRVYILINLSDNSFNNYDFGVSVAGEYQIKIDSDNNKYGGSNTLLKRLPSGQIRAGSPGHQSHGKAHSLTVPYLAPYGVVVLKGI